MEEDICNWVIEKKNLSWIEGRGEGYPGDKGST